MLPVFLEIGRLPSKFFRSDNYLTLSSLRSLFLISMLVPVGVTFFDFHQNRKGKRKKKEKKNKEKRKRKNIKKLYLCTYTYTYTSLYISVCIHICIDIYV